MSALTPSAERARPRPAPTTTSTPAGARLLRRRCACGGSPGLDGECAACRARQARSRTRGALPIAPPLVHEVLRSPGQPLDPATRAAMEARFDRSLGRAPVGGTRPVVPRASLAIGQAGDADEREAEQVAERVMQALPGSPWAGPGDQAAAPGRAAPAPGGVLRARADGGAAAATPPGVARAGEAPRGGDRPQPSDPGAAFAPRPGHDFSRVRVHADARADASARAVNALAYAVGQDIVFAVGQYAPGTAAGQRLLAHELTHVTQQGYGNTQPRLSRVAATDCAAPATCALPDVAGAGAPSSWKLTIAVDREQEGLGRLLTGNVGHTWVKMQDDVGTRYSYGFWPQTGFDRSKPFNTVAGCVHHPDTAHDPPNATDYIAKEYTLTEPNYDRALGHAHSVCAARPGYNLFTYNCTTFAIDVAKAAGVTPPSSTTLAVHNPNALYEGVAKDRAEGHPKTGALLGGLAGIAGGAALGSLLGPVGTIVGGLLGGLFGAVGGALLGDIL